MARHERSGDGLKRADASVPATFHRTVMRALTRLAVAAFVLSIIWSFPPFDMASSSTEQAAVGAVIGLMCWLFLATGSARVSVTEDSVIVVNPVFTRSFRRRDLQSVTLTGFVTLVLTDGTLIEPTAGEGAGLAIFSPAGSLFSFLMQRQTGSDRSIPGSVVAVKKRLAVHHVAGALVTTVLAGYGVATGS